MAITPKGFAKELKSEPLGSVLVYVGSGVMIAAPNKTALESEAELVDIDEYGFALADDFDYEEVEEKIGFDVILEEVPTDKKTATLKVVRVITGFSLKEAKDLIEALPKKIKEGVTRFDAEDAKTKLKKVGAKVRILGPEKEYIDKPATLHDAGFVMQEIDNIFAELTQIDIRISQSQVGIDDLKVETREMLAALRESID